MTEEDFQEFDSYREAKNNLVKSVDFHKDFSIDYVNNLSNLRSRKGTLNSEGVDEWLECKNLISYTAVKHYIIAICQSPFPVGLHRAADILSNAGFNDMELEKCIECEMDYAIDLGYLSKEVFGGVAFYKIVRFWC